MVYVLLSWETSILDELFLTHRPPKDQQKEYANLIIDKIGCFVSQYDFYEWSLSSYGVLMVMVTNCDRSVPDLSVWDIPT